MVIFAIFIITEKTITILMMSHLWESVPNTSVFFHVENKITSLDEDISAALQYFSVLLSVTHFTFMIKLLLLDIALGLTA